MSQSKPKPFARGLSEVQMAGLARAMELQRHWWRDLLYLWRPSGHETGDYGLRLAVRDGYLNFYRRGQSVARVAFSKGGEPHLSVHAKYVVSDAERSLPNLRYARLKTTEITHAKSPSRNYDGIDSLKAWIKVVDAHFTKEGDEKSLVDQLLSVSENSGVIDLEMALPAWEENKSAPRMDLVAIEGSADGLELVFGEVKVVGDPRVRCSGQNLTVKPEVIKQLSQYQAYLAKPAHREAISQAYLNTAKTLVELNKMAGTLRAAMPLGSAIVEASVSDHLAVPQHAILIVMSCGDFSETRWDLHRQVLKAEVDLRMVELGAPGPMNLGVLV
ncbi:hypothetical protein [Brevundimonas diminuta]|uniref:hypothetical protein n=1 Tax=Brevundimonas diminuta TaxID=293 RepID=UPI001F55D994|nr:hypothetical protein [Brevundimonas diminuta]